MEKEQIIEIFRNESGVGKEELGERERELFIHLLAEKVNSLYQQDEPKQQLSAEEIIKEARDAHSKYNVGGLPLKPYYEKGFVDGATWASSQFAQQDEST
jgi:hypothetical protein